MRATNTCVLDRLGAEARASPISLLRLGIKTDALTAAGIRNLELLIQEMSKGAGALARIPKVGASTVLEVESRLSAIEASITSDGSIDWDAFALASGYPLIPDRDVASGAEFIAVFSEVISGIISTGSSGVDRLILTERLTKPRREQKTLEEIARLAPGSLSRERIRQREVKLLSALSEALLFDDHNGLNIHFRKSFSGFWKLAIAEFGTRNELTFEGFVEGLTHAWDVSTEVVLAHFPLIASILTSKAQIPATLKPRDGLDPRFYGAIDSTVMNKPLVRLAIGKAADEFAELGIETIGTLVERAKWNRLPSPQTRTGKIADDVLRALASGLQQDGTVDWAAYAATLGLTQLPSRPTNGADEFLHNLNDDLEHILQFNGLSGKAAEIFRLRTGVPQQSRPTLADVANILNTHGPHVKRQETLLLETLNNQLVQHDFTRSRVYFSPDFLQYWGVAQRLFDASAGSFDQFCRSIVDQWNLPDRTVRKCVAGLWAVLNLYPHGRPPRRVKLKKASFESSLAGGVIVLRGFRRQH